MFSKFWPWCYNEAQDEDKTNKIHLKHVFANCNEEDGIYLSILKEIAEAQWADTKLKHLIKHKGLDLQFVENKNCICNKSRLVVPKPSQRHAVMWYHHYLQHPGHTHLKETMKAAIDWKGMRSNIQS